MFSLLHVAGKLQVINYLVFGLGSLVVGLRYSGVGLRSFVFGF